MKPTAILFALALAPLALAQQDEAGHMHGADGRHIVAPQQSGGQDVFLLSHHDMRIEGPDGESVLGCTVDSTIHKKGDPNDIKHTEHNAYEPENEVYGSHMTYTEPGEYVIVQDVKFPEGKQSTVSFDVYVPAVATTTEEHEHGPNWLLIFGAPIGGIALLYGVYALGKKNARVRVAPFVLLAIACFSIQIALGQEEEEGHMHGADGRHIVAPGAGSAAAGGPMLKAFPGPNQDESAAKTVDGIKFVLSIENEEMRPDPDLVAIGEDQAKLIDLQVADVVVSNNTGGLSTTGRVVANPEKTADVVAPTSGRLVDLTRLPGDSVAQGGTLAVIESQVLAGAQIAYQRANADLVRANGLVKSTESTLNAANLTAASAQRELDRRKKLAEAGAYTSPDLEAARSALSTARREQAKANTDVSSLEARLERLEAGLKSGVVALKEVEAARAELAEARSRLQDANNQVQIAQERSSREERITQQGLRTSKEIAEAETDLRTAQAGAQLAQSEYDDARAGIARAQAELNIATSSIRAMGGVPGRGNHVTVASPVGGKIVTRDANRGEWVTEGKGLYKVLDPNTVWIECDVFERDLASVNIGQSALVAAESSSERTYEGRIESISPTIDPEARTAKVRLAVSNRDEGLRENTFVRVQIGTAATDQVLVPFAAVQSRNGSDIVFVEEKPGTFRRTVVSLGARLGNNVVVLTGLTAGQKVATIGSYQLLAMGEGQ
jgi:multidrug resistance efflux pump